MSTTVSIVWLIVSVVVALFGGAATPPIVRAVLSLFAAGGASTPAGRQILTDAAKTEFQQLAELFRDSLAKAHAERTNTATPELPAVSAMEQIVDKLLRKRLAEMATPTPSTPLPAGAVTGGS